MGFIKLLFTFFIVVFLFAAVTAIPRIHFAMHAQSVSPSTIPNSPPAKTDR